MTVRLGVGAAALVAVTMLAGCGVFGKQPADSPSPGPASSGGTSSVQAPAPSGSSTAQPNDLPNGKTSRALREGDLVVSADYSTSLPLDQWTPAVGKPLRISMTAYTDSNRTQKIYLSRVTIYPSSADDQGDLGSLDQITDTAPLTPGYLVTFPKTYGWRIVVPGVNASARTVSLDIRYEFLLFEGGTNPRDYSKQTVTDRLTIPLR